MLTKLARWMTYVASYIVLYVLLFIKCLGFKAYEGVSLIETWRGIIGSSKIYLSVLVILFVISVVWIKYMTSLKCNSRYMIKADKNISIEMTAFFVPYIISMCTIEMDTYGIIINILLFVVLGIAFVSSEAIYLCPIFLFLGYKLYSSGDNYIFSKKSLEEFNLFLDENPGGVHVRLLIKRTYIEKE